MPRYLNLKDESTGLMPGIGLRLARFWPFFLPIWLPLPPQVASKAYAEDRQNGKNMSCFALKIVSKISVSTLFCLVFTYAAVGQTISPQNAPLATSATPREDPPVVAPTSSGATQPSDSAPLAATVPDTTADNTPDTSIDPASLLPDPPALPRANASLIGGTVEKLDRVRDRLTVRVFGGGKMTFAFDPRTHIYLGSATASASDLHQGDRISVDTQLDGSVVFAKTIRIHSKTAAGESQGAVVSYRGDELVLRDLLSPRPLKIRLTSETRIVKGDHQASSGDLVPGTLVAVKFGPQKNGSDTASEVLVLAVPGASFAFSGRIAALDMRLGLLILNSSTDRKTYEVYFDPSVSGIDGNLREGDDVMVMTRFDGNRYVARSVTVNARNQ
jgi:hypothetical protein